MAWGLSDLIALMDRWSVWKEVRENASKVPELEARIAALEAGPKRAPGRTCPACGEPAMRRISSSAAKSDLAEFGMRTETWQCSECGDKEEKTILPGS